MTDKEIVSSLTEAKKLGWKGAVPDEPVLRNDYLDRALKKARNFVARKREDRRRVVKKAA